MGRKKNEKGSEYCNMFEIRYSLFKLVGEVVLYNNNLKSYSQAKYTRGMCESVPNQFQTPRIDWGYVSMVFLTVNVSHEFGWLFELQIFIRTSKCFVDLGGCLNCKYSLKTQYFVISLQQKN
jgi:hypothetical protein